MKYFTKIRVAWIIAITLSAVNVTMIILSICSSPNSNFGCKDDERKVRHVKKECVLRSQLNLSDSQTVKYDSIKKYHHEKANLIVDSLTITRTTLMAELKHNPLNTEIVNELVDKVNQMNNQLFSLSIDQYLEVKDILDSTQQESLSQVYCDMFGCSKHHKPCSGKKDSHKGCESSKGCK